MFPASFGYVAAHSVGEALELLTQHGEDAKLLAGGHSLIPAMKLRLASPRTLIDLGTVPGLRGVRMDGNTLAIGALSSSGMALAFWREQSERVAVTFIGEGGSSLGEWHEAINLCAARKLPAVLSSGTDELTSGRRSEGVEPQPS